MRTNRRRRSPLGLLTAGVAALVTTLGACSASARSSGATDTVARKPDRPVELTLLMRWGIL